MPGLSDRFRLYMAQSSGRKFDENVILIQPGSEVAPALQKITRVTLTIGLGLTTEVALVELADG